MKPDFAQIKKTTDIVRVVESYGIALKREGKDFVGLCPFHEDTKPSLRVTPGKGLFRCPACRAAGNVIQFVAKKENLTDREAALKLCGSIPGVKRGSELPAAEKESGGAAFPGRGCNGSGRVRTARLSNRSRPAGEVLGRVAAFYAKALHKDRAGLRSENAAAG